MPSYFLANENTTCEFGAQLAKVCPSQCIIFLKGELGIGKTTLARGLLRALGYTGAVKSPTYTLVEEYDLVTRRVLHFDLYRLNRPIELQAIGIRDYLSQTAIWLVEWPEHGGNLLPLPDLIGQLQSSGSGRSLQFWATSTMGHKLLTQLPIDL